MRVTGLNISGIFILPALLLLIACERNDYELLDPESAGKWTLYTTADGLPSNQVSSIRLDSNGNLWVSFPGFGVARYDNNSWNYFRAATSQLINDGVNYIAGATDGTVLIGTVSGISVLAENNSWSSYVDPADGMDITSIKVASNGWIWLGTRTQGFYLNSDSGYVKTLLTGFENVRSIEEGLQGAIYIGTDKGILRYLNGNYSFIRKTDGLPDENVKALRYDSKERLWIGPEGGTNVAWIDRKGIHQVNLMTGTDSLKIRDIFEDRRGNIWFATHNNGLIRYDGVVSRSFKEFNGLPENSINCIGEDKYGNLWFGLYSKGLLKYTLPID